METAQNELEIQSFLGETCYVTPGVLDEMTKDVFMNGQCHALAMALCERYGYPMYLLAWGNEGIERALLDSAGNLKKRPGRIKDEDLYSQWEHCVVKIGRDKYLDATGVHSWEGLFSGWYPKGPENVYYLVPTTPEQMNRIYETYTTEFSFLPNVEVAREFVQAVIDEYLAPA
jgi:hypothetical protein